MFKRVLAAWVLCSFCLITQTAFGLSAQSVVVLDAVTGRVLFEKNAYEAKPMASTTKIMTAIVALEYGKLDDIVTVSARASGTEGSSMWLSVGEKQTLRDLLYGLLLNSGNDAAIAIAEHIGGNVENFAKMMNAQAKTIGAKNTQFVNPNGLDAEGHYTTAYELALITRFALQNPTFKEIVKTDKKTIPWPGHPWNRVLQNHNKLLKTYPDCDGVKTGFTKKSGRCLVSSATKNGWQAVAVTLNAPSDWQDHKEMLDSVFGNYKMTTLCEKDAYLKTVPVINGKSINVAAVSEGALSVPLAAGELEKVETRYELVDKLVAPVQFNQPLGWVKYYLGNTFLGSVKVSTAKPVEGNDVWINLDKVVEFWLKSAVGYNPFA